jgi:hypothetical protein
MKKRAFSKAWARPGGPRTMTAARRLAAILAVGAARPVAFKPYRS